MALLTIKETRRCNLLTLQQVAACFSVPAEELVRLYDEQLLDVEDDAMISRLYGGFNTAPHVAGSSA